MNYEPLGLNLNDYRPKIDDRAARGWWSPGSYLCTCQFCGSFFLGAIRSISCADCAYLWPDKCPASDANPPTK